MQTISSRKLVDGIGNGFVDLNGDCAADLVIITKDDTNYYFEIWLSQKATDFSRYDDVF